MTVCQVCVLLKALPLTLSYSSLHSQPVELSPWELGRCSLCCAQSVSGVWLFVTPWTTALQAPLSTGFSRQEYWLVMPSSIGSSWPRDQTEVSVISCIGSWIVYHWATWKASLNLCTCGIITNTILMNWRNWGKQSNFPRSSNPQVAQQAWNWVCWIPELKSLNHYSMMDWGSSER